MQANKVWRTRKVLAVFRLLAALTPPRVDREIADFEALVILPEFLELLQLQGVIVTLLELCWRKKIDF